MSDPKGWWARLRHEWAKNDGKPREDRATGIDLKEIVLVAALVVLIVIQIVVWAV